MEEYKFTGWNIDITNLEITEDIELIAQFEVVKLKEYKVIFKNYDGSILYTDFVNYGQNAIYMGDIPQKDNDKDGNKYTFIGWDVEYNNVTSDLIVTAQFSENKLEYVVTFKNYDGSVLLTILVKHGDNAFYNLSNPIRENDSKYQYEFIGWDKDLNNIVTDTEFIAQYSKKEVEFNVYFLDFKDDIIVTQKVKYGNAANYNLEEPIKPADNIVQIYSFDKWDVDYSCVTEVLVVKPSYQDFYK